MTLTKESNTCGDCASFDGKHPRVLSTNKYLKVCHRKKYKTSASLEVSRLTRGGIAQETAATSVASWREQSRDNANVADCEKKG
jgi:hypothetical protein